jgi:outer membrane cobalamin receptor
MLWIVMCHSSSVAHFNILVLRCACKATRIAAYLIVISIVISATISSKAQAQYVGGGESLDIYDLTIKELMNLPVKGLSNTEKPILEQPGVISVITKEQIDRSGARNLLDILQQVPGFWVNIDAFGAFSVGFRGIWGLEGKILLLIDGIEQNELAFGTLILGNRYSAEYIKKVEVIRGPGSVTYGGQAALAVVNVTTLGFELATARVSINADISQSGIHNNNYVLSMANILENGLKYSLSAHYGTGNYSDGEWVGLDGYTFDLDDNSNTNPLNVNLGVFYEGLTFRFFYDLYTYEDRILFGDSGIFFSPFLRYTQPGSVSYENTSVQIQYDWHFDDTIKIVPEISYSRQVPWDLNFQYGQNNVRTAHRWRIDINAFIDMGEQSNLLIGSSYYYEDEEFTEAFLYDPETRFDGKSYTNNEDFAFYFQYEANSVWVNYTIGLRFEHHDFAGNQVVPRIALTKSWDKINYKLVYNEAFKIPAFDTVASASNAGVPLSGAEKTKGIESELSYQFSETTIVQGNVFWMDISDFIAFDPSIVANATVGDISILGGELIFIYRSPWADMQLSYSLFQIDKNNISTFSIEEDPDALLGAPNHLVKLNTTIKLNSMNSININGVMTPPRYACISDPAFVCGTPKKVGSQYEFDLYYLRKFENVELGFGLANFFNSSIEYIQPYRGGSPPQPGLGRRIMFKASYQWH